MQNGKRMQLAMGIYPGFLSLVEKIASISPSARGVDCHIEP
jgi:hypothetical protein